MFIANFHRLQKFGLICGGKWPAIFWGTKCMAENFIIFTIIFKKEIFYLMAERFANKKMTKISVKKKDKKRIIGHLCI